MSEEDDILLLHRDLTELIIGAAIEVHKELGPGLLESSYETCLCHELKLRGIAFQSQLPVPVRYKGLELDCGYRLDLLVKDTVVVELKAVEKLAPVMEAQLLTYMRLLGKPVGLVLNFSEPTLKQGILRRALTKSKADLLRVSASPRFHLNRVTQSRSGVAE
jgi:GxxExxY protein